MLTKRILKDKKKLIKKNKTSEYYFKSNKIIDHDRVVNDWIIFIDLYGKWKKKRFF